MKSCPRVCIFSSGVNPVHQHVVEHAAQRVPGVGAAAGRLDRLADRDAEAARGVRVVGEDLRARGGGPGRAGVHGGAPGLHHGAPVRLLVVGGPPHIAAGALLDLFPAAGGGLIQGEHGVGEQFAEPGDVRIVVDKRVRRDQVLDGSLARNRAVVSGGHGRPFR